MRRRLRPWSDVGDHILLTERGNSMNRKLLPTFAFVVTAAFAMSASAGSVDCARPALGNGEAQACRAAAQGTDQLRQFIQRTQGIYILYMQDFADAVRQ
jgi:hypothetical protein